ncbi:hypothetical protein DFJ58DRAFT_360721 [Suillus subalutaceus]|uniref:uncharacterized protein n=1 Tax=Suillus subalutaceus TaxID=48586 RepID=UPI001B880109|nr:uncharacterized protein DFJ58DRAFT_360721 [Suillus subalutaceus]KAG1855206.1 hypothetical protein DFJ58DRAFT_360721 [Suillus subalutaceus]
MSELEESLYALDWSDCIGVVIITLIIYDYMLQLEKEVTFVWERQMSVMAYLYLVVRYFGIVLAMIFGIWGGLIYMPEAVSYGILVFMQWGLSGYFCLAEVILIWRLYALYNQSRRILYVLLGLFLPVVALYIGMDIFLWSRPSAVSVQEIVVTPNLKYCAASFHIGPMPAIYASIPIICYDIFLVVLAIVVLVKHLKERKELEMKPNTYVVMIVRYHVIYFILNLASQISIVTLWANIPTAERYLVILFKDTAPLIIAPRLIISIWDTHANDNCIHVSTTFEECVCWTSPPALEQPEIDTCV